MQKPSSKNQNTNQRNLKEMKTSDIKITVGLDENNVPDKLLWTAQDGGIEQEGHPIGNGPN